MSDRGPVPKRSDQRRRRNTDNGSTTKARAGNVTIPDTDAAWHPIAQRWYDALRESGQSQFYESSDWATAALIAESMSRDLNPQAVGITDTGKVVRDTIPLKGASLAAYLKSMTALMVTEGDRRRAHLELQRGDADTSAHDAKVTQMESYRKAAAD